MMHSNLESAGLPSRGRRRSRERPWSSGRVLMFAVLSFGTLASALTYTVLHRNQRCLTRQRTAMAASGRGPKRRHWRRNNLEAELRFRQQCKSAFGGIAGKQPVQPRTVAIVGSGQLSDAYRRELRDVMAYVVRLDWLDNMLPGERIHLWVLTWDADAGAFRGISSADWGPAAQMLSAAGAAWFIGGEESDYARVLQARQQPDSNSSRPPQWAHFPRDTWQLDHWDAVPVGGRPSAAYMTMVDTLDCLDDNVRVHLYGLPWRGKAKEGLDNTHDDAEAALVRRAASWKVVIHEMMLPAPPATGSETIGVPVEADVQEHAAITDMPAGEPVAGSPLAAPAKRPQSDSSS